MAALEPGETISTRFFRETFASFMSRKHVRVAILFKFMTMFCVNIFLASTISLGLGRCNIDSSIIIEPVQHFIHLLDQREALPNDSYLVDYYDQLSENANTGPPVYFVVNNINVTRLSGMRSICARFSKCSNTSVANILEQEHRRLNESYLDTSPAVWVDDFLQWLNPSLESCCRVRINDSNILCRPDEPASFCEPCFLRRNLPWNMTMEGFPQGPEFTKFLDVWLASIPSDDCPFGGSAVYGSTISFTDVHQKRNQNQISFADTLEKQMPESNKTVLASHLRMFHVPLRSPNDHMAAYQSARRIADELAEIVSRTTQQLHVKTAKKGDVPVVFPYSVFYALWDTVHDDGKHDRHTTCDVYRCY